MLSPRPGAASDGLGREERLEHLVLDVLRDAGAGVADREQDVAAGRHLPVILRVGLVQIGHAGLDQQHGRRSASRLVNSATD